MPPQFIHLRVHSEYSIIDGLVRIPALMSKLSELQMPAVALTDFANLFALVKFYRSAIACGIKPIIGADVLVADDNMRDRYRVALLCMNNTRLWSFNRAVNARLYRRSTGRRANGNARLAA